MSTKSTRSTKTYYTLRPWILRFLSRQTAFNKNITSSNLFIHNDIDDFKLNAVEYDDNYKYEINKDAVDKKHYV